MFASDHPSPCEHLRKKFIKRMFNSLLHCQIREIRGHDVDVNVAVAGVTKRSDGKAVFPLKRLRKFSELDQSRSRNDNILIQLGQTGRPERIAELATQCPKLFAFLFRRRDRERARAFARE